MLFDVDLAVPVFIALVAAAIWPAFLERARTVRPPRSIPMILLFCGMLVLSQNSRAFAADPRVSASPVVLRVGHFANVTHAQGVIGHHLSRQGKGWFEQRLGPGVEIQWFVYNAGPSAMEAIFGKSIDLTYVGPSPALNAYTKSGGDEIRIIAGAAVGGSALVVSGDGRIKTASDFRGKKIATPQLGNTQDVACRAWLKAHGFKVTQLGGEVMVLPTTNPDQLTLFQRGLVDAVWTVEPWVSRLELEGDGKVFLDESDAVTTVLVSRAAFLREKKEIVRRFAQAHAELTTWIQRNPDEAQRMVRTELKTETSREISDELTKRAWKRLRFTSQITRAPLDKFIAAAKNVGFLTELVDLARLLEVP